MSPRTLPGFGAAVAALLLGACGPDPAPDCAAPATVEQVMAHTLTAMLELGSPAERATPTLDWAARAIHSGPDTLFLVTRGDSLYAAEGRYSPPQLMLIAMSPELIYADEEAGSWECRAVVDARQGVAIPIRYNSSLNARGEHVVRGSLKGAEREIVF